MREARPILALVVDRGLTRHPLEHAVSCAVRGGVDWVQLRDRELCGAQWLAWAEGVADAARSVRNDVRIVVNRRVDVALAIAADGVHLGWDAMKPRDARELLGSNALVGASTHTAAEVREAAALGVDYVHLAPLFDPISKPSERPALGVDALRTLRGVAIPVLAQGGLDPARARLAMAAGADGVAVTGPILLAEDPETAARALRTSLDGG